LEELWNGVLSDALAEVLYFYGDVGNLHLSLSPSLALALAIAAAAAAAQARVVQLAESPRDLFERVADDEDVDLAALG
jgi:hypothetical protein